MLPEYAQHPPNKTGEEEEYTSTSESSDEESTDDQVEMLDGLKVVEGCSTQQIPTEAKDQPQTSHGHAGKNKQPLRRSARHHATDKNQGYVPDGSNDSTTDDQNEAASDSSPPAKRKPTAEEPSSTTSDNPIIVSFKRTPRMGLVQPLSSSSDSSNDNYEDELAAGCRVHKKPIHKKKHISLWEGVFPKSKKLQDGRNRGKKSGKRVLETNRKPAK